MTQDTNNQEWWEKEFNDEFWPLIPEGTDFDESVKTFIRKVSKQSREDALDECINTAIGFFEEQKEIAQIRGDLFWVNEFDMQIDHFKSKLSS